MAVADGARSRIEGLARAVDLARGRQQPARVETAEAILSRSRERLEHGPRHVVAALGGGTGSGKSSLSNALAGRDLSAVAPIRPTTDRALLWSAGAVEPELIRWLSVVDTHVVTPRDDLPEGLVVLDLPDHDSVRTAHRRTVDAAVKVVDIMIFVVDPMKYAQRALFSGYLEPLAHHADVLLVVLNRVDELDDAGEQRCVGDLRRLLADVGLARARLLTTSAVTGRGVDELRAVLADETRSRRAIGERITADVRQAAELLTADVDVAPSFGDGAPVVDALARAADLSGAVATAEQTYRERGLQATEGPITRTIAGAGRRLARPFRATTAARLQKGGRLRRGGVHRAETDDAPHTPQGTDVALRHALRALIDPVARGLPEVWARLLRERADHLTHRLPPHTRDALDVVALHAPSRLWWPVFAFVWTLVELAVIAGVAWLSALFVVAWLQLPDPPTPQLGSVPWPTVLVLVGIPVWLLLRGLQTGAVRRGATRHGQRTRRRLRRQVAEAAEVALRPLGEELAARDELIELAGPLQR